MDKWYVVLDRIGDGVARAFLPKPPKTFGMANGTLQESQQMLIEKLLVDFC